MINIKFNFGSVPALCLSGYKETYLMTSIYIILHYLNCCAISNIKNNYTIHRKLLRKKQKKKNSYYLRQI